MTWWADYNVTLRRRRDANCVSARRRRVGQHRQSVGRELRGLRSSSSSPVTCIVRRPATAASVRHGEAIARRRRQRGDGRLRREVVLRISPVHTRPHDHAARQLDQADRAVPVCAPRALRKDARLLRRAEQFARISAVTGDRSQLRRAKQPQGRRLPAVQEQREQRHGHAAACRPRPRLEARSRGPDARVHRRRRRSTTRHATRRCC